MSIFEEWVLPSATAQPDIPITNSALRAVFARRGIVDSSSYRRFVEPTLDDLHDPAGIHGIGDACERIARAIRDHEAIAIYGDYDVDGVTSIVLLQTVLRSLGADVDFVVPHRLVDGYGLKMEVLERILGERNVRLVITVDCGITSVEPVRMAIERGIDVIVTDHHLPPGVLPAAAAVLNPHQPGCEYPFKDLAGVGVVFKLCCELLRRQGKKMSIESLLKIAAIGTIADVAPLVEENRVIALLGLRALSDPRNRGLRAIIQRLGLGGRPLRARDIGFKIGPRINAAGRLASANTAIDLFSAPTDEAAWQLCAELDRLNSERQQIEQTVRAAAESQIVGDERILVLAGEGWHKGVLGLVAGRIAQRQHRPVLVIAIENGRCVGSGRSIPTIDLHHQLSGVGDLFTHFGGHEFACGFSFETARLTDVRDRLSASFAAIDAGRFRRTATVDATLTVGEIDAAFIEGHQRLEPFGVGNPQPLFVTRNVALSGWREFAEDCCEVTADDGTGKVPAVFWSSVRPLREAVQGAERVDLLFQIEPDSWSPRGARLSIADARTSAPE
jgi:single-stranded-DNA-specific exonuclease